MKTITANDIIRRARFRRLHPIKKRIAKLNREEWAARQNVNEWWVKEKHPHLVDILNKKIDRHSRSRNILERELSRRERKFK